jgi:hypothetical protein
MTSKGRHGRDDDASERDVGMPPTVLSLAPAEGPDGTEVTLEGGGFQTQGANSQVAIGYAAATIVSWDDAHVVLTAVRGQNVLDAPIAVMLRTEDGQEVEAGAFTFGTGTAVQPPEPPVADRTIALELTNSGDAAIGLFHVSFRPDGIMQESLSRAIQPKETLSIAALPGAVRFKVL